MLWSSAVLICAAPTSEGCLKAIRATSMKYQKVPAPCV